MTAVPARAAVVRVLFLFRVALPGIGYAMGFVQRPTAGSPADGETGEVGGCLSTCCEACDWPCALTFCHRRDRPNCFGKFWETCAGCFLRRGSNTALQDAILSVWDCFDGSRVSRNITFSKHFTPGTMRRVPGGGPWGACQRGSHVGRIMWRSCPLRCGDSGVVVRDTLRPRQPFGDTFWCAIFVLVRYLC